MSTRAFVGYKTEKGSIEYIYNHFDGYIKGGLGAELVRSYTTQQAVERLVARGDASSIITGEFYVDRGEDLNTSVAWSIDKYRSDANGIDYAYLFIDGQWLVAKYGQKFEQLVDLL